MKKRHSIFKRWTLLFQRKKMPDGHEKILGAQVIYSNVTRKHSGTYVCEGDNRSGYIANDTIKIDVIRKYSIFFFYFFFCIKKTTALFSIDTNNWFKNCTCSEIDRIFYHFQMIGSRKCISSAFFLWKNRKFDKTRKYLRKILISRIVANWFRS